MPARKSARIPPRFIPALAAFHPIGPSFTVLRCRLSEISVAEDTPVNDAAERGFRVYCVSDSDAAGTNTFSGTKYNPIFVLGVIPRTSE